MTLTERQKARDEAMKLEFVNEYVYPCPDQGYCLGDSDTSDWFKLRIVKDGPIRNWWKISWKPLEGKLPKLKDTLEFSACFYCLHPLTHWEADRVNRFMGHEKPKLSNILSKLPEIKL